MFQNTELCWVYLHLFFPLSKMNKRITKVYIDTKTKKINKMIIGCHISIAGGLPLVFGRAERLGCETFQLFTQNQRQWKSVEYDKKIVASFRHERQESAYRDVPLTSHASYLINLCATDLDKRQRSRMALLDELNRCAVLKIDNLVLHPGSHGGNGEDWGIETIAQSINYVLDQTSAQVRLLLETTAGQGNGIGHRFEHLAEIFKRVKQNKRLGICVDTCHIFAAGYDIRTYKGWEQTLKAMQANFGLERIGVIHLNDSLKPFASRRDRHAAIGRGEIGIESFKILAEEAAFKKIPGILEVPGGDAVYAENIKLLKAF